MFQVEQFYDNIQFIHRDFKAIKEEEMKNDELNNFDDWGPEDWEGYFENPWRIDLDDNHTILEKKMKDFENLKEENSFAF
jgi:hypothetical protein